MLGDKDKAEKLVEENKVIMNQTDLDEFIMNRFNELINEIKEEAIANN